MTLKLPSVFWYLSFNLKPFLNHHFHQGSLGSLYIQYCDSSFVLGTINYMRVEVIHRLAIYLQFSTLSSSIWSADYSMWSAGRQWQRLSSSVLELQCKMHDGQCGSYSSIEFINVRFLNRNSIQILNYLFYMAFFFYGLPYLIW